ARRRRHHRAEAAAMSARSLPVTLADIRAAAATIAGAIEHTPLAHSRTLSEICGCTVFLKFENLQYTASFKERGALNKLAHLSPPRRRAGALASPPATHAGGVAYHPQRLGIPAVIVMPEGTPFTKVSQTRRFGAEVVVKGADLSEAQDHAGLLQRERSL